MGLLDNMDDPQKYALMQMALGLIGGAPGGRKNFGQDVAHAGLLGLQGYTGQKAFKMREQEEAQQREMRGMAAQQMKQQMEEQAAMRAAAQRNFQPGMPQMQPTDMETPSGPSGPGTFNPQGYARDIMPINPLLGMDLQAKMQKQEPMPVSLSEGARLVDPRTGREVAANPKQVGPKPGDIRHYDHGLNTLTYEYDGKTWQKIASAPRFKPDGPEKPEKPPAGYRWAGDKLEAIKGGPADPASGKATDTERVAAGYLDRMENAEKIMGKVGDAAGRPGVRESMLAALPGGEVAANALPSFMGGRSSERQQYRQAQEDWVRAKLRKESGAVIADAEMDREIKTYFPQIGDSPEVLKQKAQARQVAIKAMRTGAGPVASVGVEDLLKKYLGR